MSAPAQAPEPTTSFSTGKGWRPVLPIGLASIVALALCRVPGFDVLDYHACLALSPVLGLAAVHLVIERATLLGWLALLLGPLTVLVVNSFWVPNCAPVTGLVFYLLGPVASAGVGACIGMIAVTLSKNYVRRVAWLIGLVTMLPAGLHFLRHPQVFAYHGLVGWIGGAIYEDALAPHATYGWFRLIDGAAWLAAAAWARGASRHEGTRAPGLRAIVGFGWSATTGRVAVCVLGAALGASSLLGAELGWRVHSDDILRRMNARIELRLRDRVLPDANKRDSTTPKQVARRAPADVVIHIMGRAGWRRRAQLIAEDVAVRWLELQAHFGRAPTEPINIYLYPDIERKRRWMGAARVEMAKPWLRQVHMVWPGWGRSITRHELAHVFAGVDAPKPFAVPLRYGFWPDALLIEGMAVAAEWPIRNGMNPHQWSAAMRHLKLAPPMERLLAPTGFFSESSARAYTLAGSLLRWLRDTYGAEALRSAYGDGDLAAATGRPLPVLLAEWAAFVDGMTLRPADRARARARFERAGLFYRPCSLEIGRCRERARRAWRRGDSGAALTAWSTLRARIATHARERSLGLDIELAYAYALGQDGQLASADQLLRQHLQKTDQFTSLQRARLHLMRGEIAVATDDLTADGEAANAWRATAQTPVSTGTQRMLTVKTHLIGQGEDGQRLVRMGLNDYIKGEPFSVALRHAKRSLPRDPVIGYLWARRRLLGRDAKAAAKALRALRTSLAPWPRLQKETDHMLAQHAARTGDCAAIEPLAKRAGLKDPAVRGWRDDMTQRCRAMRQLGTSQPWMALNGPKT